MYRMSDEESSSSPKKEEEIFGFKVSNLTALGTILALGGIGYLIWDKVKPQLPGQPQAQSAQPQAQQQVQYTPEQIAQIQAQQQQAQIQQQQAQTQQQQEPVQYGYAVEQDPMSGKITKARIREVEASEQGQDRFSSISV